MATRKGTAALTAMVDSGEPCGSGEDIGLFGVYVETPPSQHPTENLRKGREIERCCVYQFMCLCVEGQVEAAARMRCRLISLWLGPIAHRHIPIDG
jgi:hypothetical protein